MPEKFAAVRRAGFEAIGGRFEPLAPALCAEQDLEYVLYLDADASNYDEQLRKAQDWNPRRINVQLCDHDTPPDEAADVWIKMTELATELGLVIDLETHRDTATETPEKIEAIAECYQRWTGQPIGLCLDFSHSAVVKHLMPPFGPRLLQRLDLVRRARHLHLRPFNGHHAQIPVTDGQGSLSPEFISYRQFLAELLRLLAMETRAGEAIYACPENGPRISGSYGLSCFPDVWEDTIRLRDEIRRVWGECQPESV